MTASTPERGLLAAAIPLLLATLVACDGTDGFAAPEMAPSGVSRAFSAWEPSEFDTCTKQIHDQYAVVGADGKLYPTWHPPVDEETGCTFGHEHGRDPRGSDLFEDVGFVPFGLANEAADFFAPHPGFKVEWENDVPMSVGPGDVGNTLFSISCDVMVELHQGTAGSGRFVQPQHEMAFHARCTDGSEIHLQFLTNVGHPGEFVRSCESDVHVVVDPERAGRSGGGKRLVPDRTCMERHILRPPGERSNFGRLRESWQFSESIRANSGRSLVSLGPYFNVFNPSRYHDPDSPNLLGNTVDLCDEITETGFRAEGGMCEQVAGGATPAWNDPASPFDGAHRDVDINSIRIRNEDGPEVWYTDAWGENGSPDPFPGSVRQFISRVNNEVATPSGGRMGKDRNYGGQGVHAPN